MHVDITRTTKFNGKVDLKMGKDPTILPQKKQTWQMFSQNL